MQMQCCEIEQLLADKVKRGTRRIIDLLQKDAPASTKNFGGFSSF